MTRADLTSADLRGARFTRIDLSKAVLTDVCFDQTTKWAPQYISSDVLLLGQQTRCSSGVRVRLDRYSVAW